MLKKLAEAADPDWLQRQFRPATQKTIFFIIKIAQDNEYRITGVLSGTYTLQMEQLISKIELSIESAKTKRNYSGADAALAGEELYSDAEELFRNLKKSGADEMLIDSLSDKVAEELLQCGMDYFTYCKVTDTDPLNSSLDLYKKAKEFTKSEIILQKIREYTTEQRDWLVKTREIKRQMAVKPEMDSLDIIISNYKKKDRSIANTTSLLQATEPFLATIVRYFSVNDPVYLKYSTEIISIAIDNITQETETAKAAAESKREQYPEEADNILRITYLNAWAVLKMTENMYMDEKFMTEQYYPFRDSILDYCSELGISEPEEETEISIWQIIKQFNKWIQLIILLTIGNSFEDGIKIISIGVFILILIMNSKYFK